MPKLSNQAIFILRMKQKLGRTGGDFQMPARKSLNSEQRQQLLITPVIRRSHNVTPKLLPLNQGEVSLKDNQRTRANKTELGLSLETGPQAFLLAMSDENALFS